MTNNFGTYAQINAKLNKLFITVSKKDVLVTGIELANEVLLVLGVTNQDLRSSEDILNDAFSNAKFRNQKMELWFERHPYFKAARVALNHYHGNLPIETYFYQLNESSNKARISAVTQLSSNWEDSILTMLPHYKVGIDFFLNYNNKSISLVITNQGKLRVLELSEKLSNTQIEIFEKIQGCLHYQGFDPDTGESIPYEPQRTIHRTLWNSLELQEVNKKFYYGISEHFTSLHEFIVLNNHFKLSSNDIDTESKIFSTRLIGRILFLWFLKKKGIIDQSHDYFDANDLSANDYYEKKLKVLFFNVLNTPTSERYSRDRITPYLNGGLFEPHSNDWVGEKIKFPSNWFCSLYTHFEKFNFTTDESNPEYEQIAIDPEMLGRVFENLLASIRPETANAANERNNKGTFYTPREIVSFMNKEVLKNYLKNVVVNPKDHFGIEKLIDMNDAEFIEHKSSGMTYLWGKRSIEIRAEIIEALNNVKIFDPACGSGAFPIGFMQLIVRTYDRLSAFYDISVDKHRLSKSNEINDVYNTKLSILKKNLFGSDIEPMAIEIARLRSWLSIIIDDVGKIEPLPNLDFNFVCCNSLIPLDKSNYQITIFDSFENEGKHTLLREKYFNTHDSSEKSLLKNEFRELYNDVMNKSNEDKRVNQLLSWNPFESDKSSLFFDSRTMFNFDGFDIIIGNPPYINFGDISEESKKIYKTLKYLTYDAQGDIYTLFFEMGVNNLKDNGLLAFITSNKWLRASYGEKLRNFFIDSSNPKYLIDLGSGVFESATVDTSILIIEKSENLHSVKAITLDATMRLSNLSEIIQKYSINTSFSYNEPWTITSKLESSIKEKIERKGIPLKYWSEIDVNRGVLTGLNDAFILNKEQLQEVLKNCRSDSERSRTLEIIKPVLRGKDIKMNRIIWADRYLIAMVPFKNYKIDDFPSIKDWFTEASWSNDVPKGYGQSRLEQSGATHKVFNRVFKSRKKTSNKWFETQDPTAYIEKFKNRKIVFPAIMSNGPSFAIDDHGYLVNAPGNILIGENLDELLLFLNTIGYYALRKFYMGGGIEGELKVNRIEILPLPKDYGQLSTKQALYEYFDFSIDEIDEIEKYLNTFEK